MKPSAPARQVGFVVRRRGDHARFQVCHATHQLHLERRGPQSCLRSRLRPWDARPSVLCRKTLNASLPRAPRRRQRLHPSHHARGAGPECQGHCCIHRTHASHARCTRGSVGDPGNDETTPISRPLPGAGIPVQIRRDDRPRPGEESRPSAELPKTWGRLPTLSMVYFRTIFPTLSPARSGHLRGSGRLDRLR
jgi:hypothetical protein